MKGLGYSTALLLAVSPLALTQQAQAKKADTPSIEIGGRVQVDYETFDGVHTVHEDDDELSLRRARLKLQAKLNKQFSSKIQISYDEKDNEWETKDVYLRYRAGKFADITLGQFKEAFGLENLTSSKNISTLERSVVTQALPSGRNVGLGLSKATKKYSWAVGGFDISEDQDDDTIYALTARYTFSPINSKGRVLHFGVAGSWREGSEKQYRINERAEVFSGDKVVTNDKKLQADTIQLLGLEAAWVDGPLSLQGELSTQSIEVTPDSNDEDSTYTGYYLLGSYFLTGESRRYKKGRFSSIKPKNKSGAWELVARYSVLNAEDNDRGNEVNNLVLGVNYYLNKQVRFLFNYTHTELSEPLLREGDSIDTGDAVAIRAQYVF